MGRLTRVAIAVATGAGGLLVALATVARADIVDPSRPFEAPKIHLHEKYLPQAPVKAADSQPQAPEAVGVPSEPVSEAPAPPAPEAAAAPAPEAAIAPAPGTPVPEQRLTRAPSRARAHRGGERAPAPVAVAPFEPLTTATHKAFRDVGVFLTDVTSACKVGIAGGTGGPVPLVAVLATAAALERRRTARARLVTDEDVPEFLYAWDVIAPG